MAPYEFIPNQNSASTSAQPSARITRKRSADGRFAKAEKDFGIHLPEEISKFINAEERESARLKAAREPRRRFLAVREGARTSNRSSPYARKGTSSAGIIVPRRRRREETPAHIPTTPAPAPAPPLFSTPEPFRYSETINVATGHISPWKSTAPLESPTNLENISPESDGEVFECNGEVYIDPLPESFKQGWPDGVFVELEDDGLHDTQPPIDYEDEYMSNGTMERRQAKTEMVHKSLAVASIELQTHRTESIDRLKTLAQYLVGFNYITVDDVSWVVSPFKSETKLDPLEQRFMLADALNKALREADAINRSTETISTCVERFRQLE